MAQGDVVLFQDFIANLGTGVHNLNTNTIKFGLIKSAANGGDDPANTDADPCWGAGGTTNFATAQVSETGGNYASGGPDITNTYSETTGTGTLDATNVSITSNASNPTNARWGILYDDTATNKNVIAYVDLGSDFDMTTGDLSVNWNASGIATIAIV
jgi:hypothetical protein